MTTESNTCFGLVISGVAGETEVCSLHSQNASDLRLGVEEKTTASYDWIGCNFKPFRGHIFMTVTKNDQFLTSPSAKNEQ